MPSRALSCPRGVWSPAPGPLTFPLHVYLLIKPSSLPRAHSVLQPAGLCYASPRTSVDCDPNWTCQSPSASRLSEAEAPGKHRHRLPSGLAARRGRAQTGGQAGVAPYLGHVAEVGKALGTAEGPAPEGVQGSEGVYNRHARQPVSHRGVGGHTCGALDWGLGTCVWMQRPLGPGSQLLWRGDSHDSRLHRVSVTARRSPGKRYFCVLGVPHPGRASTSGAVSPSGPLWAGRDVTAARVPRHQ